MFFFLEIHVLSGQWDLMLLVLGQDTHRFRCSLCCKRSNPEVEILLKEPMPPNFMVQATEEMMARRAGDELVCWGRKVG